MKITLSYPDKGLNPNSSKNWGKHHRLTIRAKEEAFYQTKATGPRFSGPVRVKVEIFPPDRRKRDLDNALASLKAAFDGVKMAIGIDDSEWTWDLPSGFGEPVKGGAVQITLEAV